MLIKYSLYYKRKCLRLYLILYCIPWPTKVKSCQLVITDMLRKVTLASNASTKRDFRQRQLFFIICLENQWYYICGFGYFLHQKDKTEKKKCVFCDVLNAKEQKNIPSWFCSTFNSDDVCYQGCTHVEYLDKEEASLGKIFCFTWLCKSSFKSLASQHITGNIFLSKDKPQKRDVDLSG